MNSLIDRLISAFGRLPGIGARSAERLAHHILKAPEAEALELADAIRLAKQRIRHCTTCFHLTEADEPVCAICRDPRRDSSLICVVEQPRDLIALEASGSYGGVYHVLLGRLAPLQGIGPDQLTLEALVRRVESGPVQEIILATNPNLEGDSTALLVAQRLSASGVRITRLARGLASGSQLEFANKEMLADALSGRQPWNR
ncbi:MAG: recombination protein RecR [Isosphaeraceae bacterium]|jgi:recombination protein RecR|nr:MAG: recombination protein RecR [Isosphaeraceae bacterium]